MAVATVAPADAAADPLTAPPVSSIPTQVDPRIISITDPADLAMHIGRLVDAQDLGLDLMTTGLNPHADVIRLVTLAAKDIAYVVDARACIGWAEAIGPVLADPYVTKVLHDAAFDLAFLLRSGLEVRGLHDSMLAAQLIDGGEHLHHRGYFTLAALAERELGRTLNKSLQTSDWSVEHLTQEQVRSAALDATTTRELYDVQVRKLAAEGLVDVAALEFSVVPSVAWLSLSGTPFDAMHWADLSDAAMERKLRVATEIEALVGRSINLDSPKQIQTALAELGIAVDSTAEEALIHVVDRHPIVCRLLEYGAANKRAQTYRIQYLCHVNPASGRIHASYRQIGAGTGRMSCSKPNLQSVPRDRECRACFHPPAGRALIKADLALVELAVAAELSGDERMIQALTDRQDLHRLTAAALFGKAPGDVTIEERAFGKSVNFATLYGQGRRGLIALAVRHGLTLTDRDAQRFQRRFTDAWPQLAAWQRRQMRGTTTVIRTALGRIRRLRPDISGTVRVNTPIQGTAADGFKAALVRMWETRDRVPRAVPVLCVHDEMVVECDEAEVESVRLWLVECLTAGMKVVLQSVPIVVEAVIIADWSGTPVRGATETCI